MAAGRKTGGRKLRLTASMQETICQAVRACYYLTTAARFCSISKTTVFRWFRQGEKARAGKFRDFHDAVCRAQAEFEVRHMQGIERAARATESWQAYAWRLERTMPHKYGRAGAEPRAEDRRAEHRDRPVIGFNGSPAPPEPQGPPPEAEDAGESER